MTDKNVHWSLIKSFCLKRKIYRWHPMQIYVMIWFICHCTKLENIFCNIFPPISNLQTWMSFHDLEFYQYNFNAMTMTRLFCCLHFVACGIILNNGTIHNVNFTCKMDGLSEVDGYLKWKNPAQLKLLSFIWIDMLKMNGLPKVDAFVKPTSPIK